MVSPWIGALLLAAVGLRCWPRRRADGGGISGRYAARARRGGLGRIGIGVAAALLVVVTPVEKWALLAAAAMAVGTAARLLRRGRLAKRARIDVTLVARAVGMIVREVEAGASPAAAGRAAAAELPPELASFVLGAVEVDGGVGSVSSAGARAVGAFAALASPGLASASAAPVVLATERLRVVLSAANRHGIAVAGVLTAAAQDLRDRADAAERRVSSTAGAVVSGYVLAALPVGGLGLGAAMGAEPWSVLTGSALGGALLVTGVALLCAGLLWADRLVRGRDD